MKTLLTIVLCGSLCAAQEIRRPTTDADSLGICGGQHVISSAMPNARDAAGQSTSSTISIGAAISCTQYSCTATGTYVTRVFAHWQAPGSTYTSLTLNINSLSPGWQIDPSGATGAACLYYRTTNAGSWTQIRCDSGTGWAQRTDSITLSASQDLSQLQVAACTEGHTQDGTRPGPPPAVGADVITIFDIWTLANANGQGAGNGSTAHSRHNAVLVN